MQLLRRLTAVALVVCALPALSLAQGGVHRVSGQITEADTHQPIASATVQVIGTGLGTQTGEDGRFVLAIPSDRTVQLRVRRIGYRAQIVSVSSTGDVANIALERDALRLETQVVTGQATTVSSQNAANAVAVVSGEQLNRVPAASIENALQGKVSGATITSNSGAPGGGVQVQIRGPGTVNGLYQPLYVIDGVIANNSAFSTGLNALTAAGVPVGGVAASGGVTQAGAAISSSQDQQVNRIADLNPEDIESIEVLKGPSAGAIYGSKGANGVIVITTKTGRAGKPALNVIQRVGKASISNEYDMRCFSQSDAASYIDGNSGAFGFTSAQYFAAHPYAGCTDPFKQLYSGNGTSYETSASLRGGAANTTFFTAGTVKHDQGLMQNTGYDKQSLRLNLAQQFSRTFNVRASSELIHTLTERGISGNDNTTISPLAIISSTPTFFNFAQRDPATGDYIKNPWVGNRGNVLQEAAQVHTPENVYRLLGSLQGSLSLVSSARQTLDLTALAGIDAYTDDSRLYSPPSTYIEQSGSVSPFPGTVVNGKSTVQNANMNVSLVHKLITSPFTATTSAGVRQEREQEDFVSNLGQGLFPGITNFSSATQTASAEGQSLAKTFSYFAQEELLALDERLLLSAAVNAERSSTNGDASKFYAFPKFAASYRLPFLPPFTDNVKLRVAYGKAGNRVPVDFKYTFLTALPYAGTVGLIPARTVGLPTIKPELSTEIEGGVDAQFLNGRVALDFTKYKKTTRDLVLQAGVAPTTGFTLLTINGGQLRNTGTEIGVDLVPIQSQLVSWTLRTTYSSNRSLVVQLPVAPFASANGFSERFGLAKVVQGLPNGVVAAFMGKDASGARKEVFFGEAGPDFQMGFSNEVSVGPLRFSSLLDWRKGGWAENLTDLYFDANIPGGNLADTALARTRSGSFGSGNAAYLQHATFLKLRELTLAYSLSPHLASTLFRGASKDVRLEVSGRNLKTWTKYTGLDPEVSNYGNAAIGRFIDVAPYPPSRTFFFTIDFTL